MQGVKAEAARVAAGEGRPKPMPKKSPKASGGGTEVEGPVDTGKKAKKLMARPDNYAINMMAKEKKRGNHVSTGGHETGGHVPGIPPNHV